MHFKYKYNKSVAIGQHRRFSNRRLLVALSVVIILAAAGYIVFDKLLSEKRKTQPKTNNRQTVLVGAPRLYKTPYFQFEDTADWRLGADASGSEHFVFRRYRGSLVEAELMVYVNNLPVNIATQRVLPVTVNADGRGFAAGEVSDPCVKVYSKGELHIRHMVTMEGMTFECDPDTPQYIVALANRGGDYKLKMARPNGQPLQLFILFHDVTIYPGPESILRISKSFKIL